MICASICVAAFAAADRMSRAARDGNQAILAAQTVAEELKAGECGPLFWDREWNRTEEDSEAFCGEITEEMLGNGLTGRRIRILDHRNNLLFWLETETYNKDFWEAGQ